MKPLQFQMANRLEEVDPTVLLLKQRLEGLLPDEAQFRFDLCVTEALTNLVLHAKPSTQEATIDGQLTVRGDEVVIELFDPEGAQPFDLRDNARSLSDIDAMAEGGRGLGLILECADRVNYGSVGRRNRLELAFKAQS